MNAFASLFLATEIMALAGATADQISTVVQAVTCNIAHDRDSRARLRELGS